MPRSSRRSPGRILRARTGGSIEGTRVERTRVLPSADGGPVPLIRTMPEHSDPFADLPEQEADPVEWDPQQRRFVPQPGRATVEGPTAPAQAPPTAASPVSRDERRFFVGVSAVGQAPPPRVDDPASSSPP